MGYRSEVAIAIANEKVEEFKSKLNEDGKELVEQYCEIHEFDDHTVFHWDWLKWYDNYEDVKSVTEAFNSIDDDYKEMIRIGESGDDIEDNRFRPNANNYWLSWSSPTILLMGKE